MNVTIPSRKARRWSRPTRVRASLSVRPLVVCAPYRHPSDPTRVQQSLSRSLRTVYSAISSIDLSSRSGGIEGRPPSAYIASNVGESFASASSASFLIARSGCVGGPRDSGDISNSIDDCFLSSPRIVRRRVSSIRPMSIPDGRFQQPASRPAYHFWSKAPPDSDAAHAILCARLLGTKVQVLLDAQEVDAQLVADLGAG
jgi:hypothetical protein